MVHSVRKNVNYPTLSINGINIERVADFNFLGIQLSEDLKWSKHQNNISLMLTKTVGVLNRLKYEYPLAILKTLYNTLLLPHLNYGILLWGSETESIHKVQKRALRIISDNKFNAHTEPICRAERLLKVKKIYRLGIYKFYYKLINNHLPHYFQDSRHSLRYKLMETLNNTSETIIEMAISQSQKYCIAYIKNDMIATYRDCCDIPNCCIIM